MNPLSLLTGGAWKIGTFAAGAVAVGLGLTLIVVNLDRARIDHERLNLVQQIQDPHTGYAARLAQSESNVTTMRVAVEHSNKALATLSAADAARLAAATKALAVAQAASRRNHDRLAVFMSRPPAGADRCAQAEDIDRRVVELLR